MAKYVFLTGGVVSGLGKGITAASLGVLLKARGYTINLQKIDPYFNVDSSNLSPYQHGEIFVTNDGGESDLVIGHYERMIDETLSAKNDVTSGQIYSSVIAKERNGEYEGRTVQVVPHITNEIKDRIRAIDDGNSDIIIVEIGGTVGDMECNPFLEAVRQFQSEVGKNNIAFIHVTLVPYIEMSGEQKTKPTQRSVKGLQNEGIQPDIIVCRSEYAIDDDSKKKLGLFCNVNSENIVQNLTTDEIYSIPLSLEQEGLARAVLNKLKLENKEPNLDFWTNFLESSRQLAKLPHSPKIGIVGKYVEKHGAYASLTEALFFSSVANKIHPDIVWISSEDITKANTKKYLSDLDGIIIPAGFGERGFEGKILASNYARVNDIPCLMIGLGAQAGAVEFARNICGLKDSDSTEFNEKTKNPVVYNSCKIPTFKKGAHTTILKDNTKIKKIYNAESISERHRHKYDFNPKFIKTLEDHGFIFSGISKEDKHPDIFELKDKKFYIGVIFSPEFKARPNSPHPLINEFIISCKK